MTQSCLIALVTSLAMSVTPALAAPEPDALWSTLTKTLAASPSRGDLDAVVAAVGKDPEALTKWVADHVRWEPYEGVLRGAAGTAAARGGNAVDRALLLQALLERAGKKGTLMARALSAKEGKALLAAFLADSGAAPLADVPRLGAEADAGLGASSDEAAARQKADDAAVEAAVAAANRVGPLLSGALAKALKPRRLAPPRTHVWVELGGLALDPAGDGLGHAGGKALSAGALDQLGHTVVVSLVMKRKRAGKAKEETLLQVPVPLHEAAWAPIELTLQPDQKRLGMSPDEIRKSPRVFTKKLDNAILRASLLIGKVRHGAAAFDRSGQRYDIKQDGQVGGPEALGGSLGGAFGGFGGGFGGGPKKPAAEPTELESVVVRVEVRGPSAKNDPQPVHERILVTASGPELPVVRMWLLLENLALAPGERERSTLRALLAGRPAFDALQGSLEAVGPKVAPPREPAGTLMRYADLRRRVQHRLMAGEGASAQQLRERTGLVALFEQLAVSGDGLVVQERFDIFANAVAYVNSKGGLDPRAALASGVADTALEAALLGPASEAAKRGTAWAQLGSQSGAPKVERDGPLLKVAWSDAAWWSVDPRSGAVVGRVPGGGGQGMTEYAFEVASTVCAFGWALSAYAAATPNNEYYMEDADKWASRICAVITGTEIQTYQMEQISEIRSALWKVAIPALRGVPHPTP